MKEISLGIIIGIGLSLLFNPLVVILICAFVFILLGIINDR